MKFLLFNENKSNQRLHPPPLNPTSNSRSILFQNATINSSIISSSLLSFKFIINLVSLIVVINLVFQNVGVDGQKTERILEEHTEYHHPSHSHHQNPSINRPRFRNGTLFHFGLRNRQPLPSPTLSSSDQFAVNRINNGDNIAPNTVIHVSNRVNVLDDDTDRTHTDTSWIHRDDVGSERTGTLTRTGDVTGDSRTDSIRYKIISVEPTSSINNRTLSSSIISSGGGDSRFSHRTGLDAYHRAAAGLDFDSNVDGNRDIGSSVGHTITRTGSGISLEEFGRASSTSGSGSGGHRNHVDISHRFETGSDRADEHSGLSGRHHLDGHQNRIVVRPINRTVIYSGGSTAGLDSGHQNILNVGSGVSNRTFIHNGPGGQTIHSIHRDRANLGGGGLSNINRTVIIHTVSTGIGSVGDGHQDHVHNQSINRTHHIYSGPGANLGITNRTFVHSGAGGINNQIHHSTYGGLQDRITLNRTGSHVHSGSGSTGAIHLGHGLGGTNYGAINRTFVHSGQGATNVGSSRVFNHTGAGHSGHGHSAGYQDLVNVGAINRTSIYPSVSGSGSTIHLGHGVNLSDVANRTFVHSGGSAVHTIGSGHQDRVINRTSNIQSGSTTGGSTFTDASRATNIGSAIHLDNRNRIDGVGGLNRLQTDQSGTTSFGTGTATEYETRDRVALGGADDTLSGARLGNIRAGSSSSTTGSATQLDNVDVEAINKARIYAEQANEEQAKKHAQNVVRLAATDQLESEIITNKTRAYLSCESGEMIVKINFSEPFRGVGYADYDRSSPCRFYGDGGKYYEMRLPLKGCGTKQEAPRIFINNIILRFHRSLELEEDEIKTIICRYPPPLAPPPPLIAAPILEQPPPAAPFIPAKLSELELLLIVSALLFLTLLLLGIGIGYYCLKKRKVKVVRKFVPPAEIPYFPPPSISSEEHSIISEQSIVQRDDYQFQNLGYIPEAKLSYLDDMFYHDQDLVDDDVVLTQQNFIVPPVSQFHTKKFDDRYVTQASETDIDTDFEVDRLIVPKKPKITTLITEDYFLSPKTTTEIIDEVTTHRVVVPPKKPLTTKRLDDTFVTPMVETDVEDHTTRQRVFGPPKVTTEKVDDLYVHSESETEVVDDQTKHRLFGPTVVKKPIKPSVQEQDDYFRTDIYEIDEVLDDVTETKIHHGPPPTTRVVQTTEDDEIITHSRDVEEFVDDTKYRRVTEPVGGPLQRKPKITVQNIDDFYVTNITETETNEQITKIGRSMPNLTLQVDFEEKEEVEETNRITGFDVKMRTIPRKPSSGPKTSQTITTSETITSTTTKIDEVLRVLENPPREKLPGLDEHFMLPTRNRLRQVIVTDETFRTLIMESTTVEEYVERIQLNPSYGPLFEPPTWEVIFRLLSLPEINRPPPRGPRGRYSDTYRSGVSSHEVRSVTEEDVTFTKSRMTSSHYVPLPDYPMDDDDLPSLDKPKSKHWASWLPDPRHYERHSPEFSPITPAFGTTRSLLGGYGSGPRRRGSPTSGVFGPRRLENPYTTTDSPSAARRRIFDYDIRPYSPDLDALSLEPSQTYLAYSGSIRKKNHQVLSEEREEIKSTTETNVYDWKRYAN